MSSPSKARGDLTFGPNGDPIATAPVLAQWLGLTGKAVYDLAKAGILVRSSRDSFLVKESVRRYCDYVRGTLPKHEADNKDST